MIDTTVIIKEATFDIISVITIWGLCNDLNLNVRINNKIYYMYTNIIGFGISAYILRKYI